MDFYSAFLMPGALTILVVILSWFYLKDGGKVVSDLLATYSNCKEQHGSYSNPVKKEDLSDDEVTQENDDDNLREEVQQYLINPDEIQSVPEQIPLDNNTIQKEMKEKGMENIQTYYKTSRLHIKEMEGLLSQQEREQERIAQRKQLEQIYKLMAQEKDKFGVESMDQIEEQMRMYNVQ